jgi:hypothetical protein
MDGRVKLGHDELLVSVTRGLDPPVHRSSQEVFCEEDGWQRNSGLPEFRAN